MSGCNLATMYYGEYEETTINDFNESNYSYETLDAMITEIDVVYWFATVPRWKWDISVLYEEEELEYQESGYSSGAFNKPSFADSKIGDIIQIEIRKKIMNGEAVGCEIIRIIE